MTDSQIPSRQPALPYTGAPPSQHFTNTQGQPVPQWQPSAHYERTPPYTENPQYTAGRPSTSAQSYSSGPPSYTASADPHSPPRLLHVYHSGMSHRNTQILGPDKTTVLYTIKISSGNLFRPKPNVTVYRGDMGTVVGTATFRSLSRDIEMVIHDNPVALSPSGLLTSAHEWTSLAYTAQGNSMRLKWKSDKFFNGGDMICLDQQGKVCAKFENSMWALRKDGKFELGPFVSGVLMDEVVLTGITMLELKRRNSNSSSSAASGGTAAAAGGGGGGC